MTDAYEASARGLQQALKKQERKVKEETRKAERIRRALKALGVEEEAKRQRVVKRKKQSNEAYDRMVRDWMRANVNNGQWVTQKQVSDALDISSSSLSLAVKRLEEQGHLDLRRPRGRLVTHIRHRPTSIRPGEEVKS